jgi:hypothetical protein
MTELAIEREDTLFGERASCNLLSEKDLVYMYEGRPVGTSASGAIGFISEWKRGPRWSMVGDPFSNYTASGDELRVYVTSQVFDTTWFRPTLEAVSRLRMVTAQASGYGESPTDTKSAASLIGFLSRALDRRAPAPSLAPLSDGGIQAEWHRGGLDVEILVSDDEGESGVYVRDRETGAEQEFPLDVARFREAVSDRLSIAR